MTFASGAIVVAFSAGTTLMTWGLVVSTITVRVLEGAEMLPAWCKTKGS